MKDQLYLDKDMQPPKVPEVEDALYAWLNAKADAKDAAERVRIRHETLLTRMDRAGLERYPFLDPQNGKKKHVVASKETKAKTVQAPAEHKSKRRREADVEPVEKSAAASDVVEHSDPFGSTRRALEGAS